MLPDAGLAKEFARRGGCAKHAAIIHPLCWLRTFSVRSFRCVDLSGKTGGLAHGIAAAPFLPHHLPLLVQRILSVVVLGIDILSELVRHQVSAL